MFFVQILCQIIPNLTNGRCKRIKISIFLIIIWACRLFHRAPLTTYRPPPPHAVGLSAILRALRALWTMT